jgi:hypothetical protein
MGVYSLPAPGKTLEIAHETADPTGYRITFLFPRGTSLHRPSPSPSQTLKTRRNLKQKFLGFARRVALIRIPIPVHPAST